MLRLRRSAQPAPLQANVLERWPDGSLRWVLCRFRANWEPGIESAYEVYVDDARIEAGSPMSAAMVSEKAARIETGAATFEVIDDTGFRLNVTDIGDVAPWTSVRLRIADANGIVRRDMVDEIRLESDGSLEAAVAVSGRVAATEGLSYEIRMQFFRDLAAVRAEIRVRNSRRAEHAGGFWDLGDPASVLLREVALVAAFREPIAAIRCSPSMEMPLQPHKVPFEIYQESSGGVRWNSPAHRNRNGVVPLKMQGYDIRDGQGTARGTRATPIVSATVGRHQFAATVPYFWQEFPKSIGVDAMQATVALFPSRFPDLHELQAGEQKTHVVGLAFGPDPVTDVPLDWCRDPLTVVVPPQQFAAANAFPAIAPAPADRADVYERLVAAAIEGSASFVQKRETIDEYGWRDFGDVYADHEAVGHTGEEPLVSHYNNQYDGVAGSICQYMRTGDVRWWTLADELARHVVDIDIYHTEKDKPAYNGGLFWHSNHYLDAATGTHRCYSRRSGPASGGPSNEHNYTTGLVMHYLMTGRVASRDGALTLAEWVVNMDDGRLTPFRWMANAPTGLASATASPSYHGPGRGAANSINALLDAHRLTADRRWLDKAEQLMRRCINPNDDVAGRNLLDAERRWSYTVFLQVLGKYLDYKALLDAFDEHYSYARSSLLHYADWMAGHERPYLERPEALEHPTETWMAQDMRKSDVFRIAARHALEAERETYRERSQFFYDYALSALDAAPTKALTRPVVILLTNGYAHRGPSAIVDVPTLRTLPAVFPPAVPFVPQKTVAIEWAFFLGAMALAITVALLLWWLLRA